MKKTLLAIVVKVDAVLHRYPLPTRSITATRGEKSIFNISISNKYLFYGGHFSVLSFQPIAFHYPTLGE